MSNFCVSKKMFSLLYINFYKFYFIENVRELKIIYDL